MFYIFPNNKIILGVVFPGTGHFPRLAFQKPGSLFLEVQTIIFWFFNLISKTELETIIMVAEGYVLSCVDSFFHSRCQRG